MTENNLDPNTENTPSTPQTPTPPPSPYESTPGNAPSQTPIQQTAAQQPVVQQAPVQSYPQQSAQQGFQQNPPQLYPQAPQQAAPQQGYQQMYQQQGYQQTYQQPGYQQGYQQQPVYYQMPPQAPQQSKSKVWPWVLGGCLIIALLGLGGCVGCIAFSASLAERSYSNSSYYDDYFDAYSYDSPYSYNFDYDDYFDGMWDDSDYTYSIDDLKELVPDAQSKIVNGEGTTGVYEVGKGKDIEAGLYYFEGDQATEGNFYLFKKDSKSGEYALQASVIYYGNYYADLEEGDALVFFEPESAHFSPATDKPIEVKTPYESGCYRVGIDIPAGTYKVTYQTGAPLDSSGDPAAFIMKDLKWNDDSILASYYVITGGSHTITVEEGQYLELYEATAVAVSPDGSAKA